MPKTVNDPAPAGFTSKRTAATPESPSVALAVTSTAPETKAEAAGEETEPDGDALSTVFGSPGSSSLATLPVASVTTARRS